MKMCHARACYIATAVLRARLDTPQVLDRTAGAWDEQLGARLVKLALWCSMHEPSQRPAVGVVHADLQKMVAQLQRRGLLSSEM